jgi:hypothetical protein
MLRIGTKTDRPAAEVIERAVAFFGPGSVGLELRHRAPDHVTFEGGGGFVTVEVVPEDDQRDVTVVTQEWEHDARRFIEEQV